MDIVKKIQQSVAEILDDLGHRISPGEVMVNQTRKEFEGDMTIVVFPFVKSLKKSPEEVGNALGQRIISMVDEAMSYNVVKGFLNIKLSPQYWSRVFENIVSNEDYGSFPTTGETIMVEFSSPNTNKPLHLGHIRNILLGDSVSRILTKAGHKVIRTQIINDRGIAVCKSMLAWQKFGHGETPETSGIKGDHLVGKYYVIFEQKFMEEYLDWQNTPQAEIIYQEKKKENEDKQQFFKRYKNEYFNDYSILGNEARDMLLAWETNDPKVRQLWMMMNGWVYEGFEKTYNDLGGSFDKLYYESDTYLLGKSAVEEGLEKGVFYRKEDGSVWCDLSDVGMDHKIVLRSDGTAVYMTQDIGTAQIRYKEFGANRMVYVVGDEQDYHFRVLFEILKRLGVPYAGQLYHLSYGMIDLPTGRMKSREGKVVDADDLIAEVIEEARNTAGEKGEIAELPQDEQDEILRRVGLAALKFMIIKVAPKKRMVFDPSESVDMQGQTGPYVQNAYVRIKSVLRKQEATEVKPKNDYLDFNEYEETLLKVIVQYPEVIKDAAENYDPALVANYCYELAKNYHRFYHEVRILNAETLEAKNFRLKLSKLVANILKSGMELLGIEMPDRM